MTIKRSPVVTGYANPGCYASGLYDCDHKLSREHYISQALLKELGGAPIVSGLPWQQGPNKLGSKTMAAKVLCERHNGMLSPLDQVGGRFFKALSLDTDHGLWLSHRQLVLFAGEDVERWLLKALLGAAFSGNLPHGGDRFPRSGTPPTSWLEILFGLREMPSKAGLYWLEEPEAPMKVERRFGFAPLYLQHQSLIQLVGCYARFVAASFILLMEPEAAGDPRLEGSVHRPAMLSFVDRQHEMQIAISFQGRQSGVHLITEMQPFLGP